MKQHNRLSTRLKDYNYSSEGAYYVTVCANNRECVFGNAQNGEMIMNDTGKMIDRWWRELPRKYNMIEIDEYKIMPNHMHGIITIVGAGFPRPDTFIRMDDKGRGNRAPTLGQIMAYFKYGTTKQINAIRNTPGIRLWQRNYYDHIIRDEESLNKIREYIINNPVHWEGIITIVGAGYPRPYYPVWN